MNVPMYLRDEEREMDRLMEEKEERWRREGQHTTPPPPDPNTIPEMQMSLEVAYNMWLVRFGDMWVKSEDVQDADGFRWPLAARRLRDMRLMEVTTVSNHYRLVPHVWT